MNKLDLLLSGIFVFGILMLAIPTQAQEHEVQKDNYVFHTTNLTRYKFPTHINDLVMDRSESAFSEVFIVIIEPGKAPPLHRHNDTEQIFYVLEGEGMLTIGKKNPANKPVSPGNIVRIPVRAWHSIKATSEVNLKYLAIDCFGSIRNENEPTWDAHVKVLCKEQGWDYNLVKENHNAD
jgi:mannose-6-phosphate isomerase-like protein (cupin superfamily)